MKVWNYFFISITLLVLFNIFGVLGSAGLLSLVGFSRIGEEITFNPSGLQAIFIGLLIAAGVAGIAIGILTKSKSENYAILPIITGVGHTAVLTLVVGSFVSIWGVAASYPSYLKAILSVIFVPLIAGYLLALLEFFRGTD